MGARLPQYIKYVLAGQRAVLAKWRRLGSGRPMSTPGTPCHLIDRSGVEWACRRDLGLEDGICVELARHREAHKHICSP